LVDFRPACGNSYFSTLEKISTGEPWISMNKSLNKIKKALFQIVINTSEISNPGRLIAVLAINGISISVIAIVQPATIDGNIRSWGGPLGLAVAAATLMIITHL